MILKSKILENKLYNYDIDIKRINVEKNRLESYILDHKRVIDDLPSSEFSTFKSYSKYLSRLPNTIHSVKSKDGYEVIEDV